MTPDTTDAGPEMATDLHADVTPEKALKMISKAIEAQEKHDVSALRAVILLAMETYKSIFACVASGKAPQDQSCLATEK